MKGGVGHLAPAKCALQEGELSFAKNCDFFQDEQEIGIFRLKLLFKMLTMNSLFSFVLFFKKLAGQIKNSSSTCPTSNLGKNSSRYNVIYLGI